mgnify:CR=1 FL=1
MRKRIFGVPEHMFSVKSGDIGGSFGMKSEHYAECALVLWASKALGPSFSNTANPSILSTHT